MSYPKNHSLSTSNNHLINEELSYDTMNLANEYHVQINCLTTEQRFVFEDIITIVENNNGGIFYGYGYGNTGKTFLWKTLSTCIRSKGRIVINVASSGIASLLLTEGRTIQSRFHIPSNLNEDSMCYMKPNSEVAELLKETKLIIRDDASLVHKHAFEALDRTLRDILLPHDSTNIDVPFGGKAIVFGGDFIQILLVIKNGCRQEIINASLSSSFIWNRSKLLILTKNMRLNLENQYGDLEKKKEFANWLLELGEENLGGINYGETSIEIRDDILIDNTTDPLANLIQFVYPSILQQFKNPEYFRKRAIMAPKNEFVQQINDQLFSRFPGDEVEYLSSDILCQTEQLNERVRESLNSSDVLNGLKKSGLANHKLVLKVGVLVMLLRNIDQHNGLCNCTRLQIVSLCKRVIEAEIIFVNNIGTRTFIL